MLEEREALQLKWSNKMGVIAGEAMDDGLTNCEVFGMMFGVMMSIGQMCFERETWDNGKSKRVGESGPGN